MCKNVCKMYVKMYMLKCMCLKCMLNLLNSPSSPSVRAGWELNSSTITLKIRSKTTFDVFNISRKVHSMFVCQNSIMVAKVPNKTASNCIKPHKLYHWVKFCLREVDTLKGTVHNCVPEGCTVESDQLLVIPRHRVHVDPPFGVRTLYT